MENLTPTRFSTPKNITGTKDGKAYSFFSIGFQTREHGDRWFNLAYNKDNPLKEGTTYEFEVKERPYTGKDGSPKVAYDAKIPTAESKMSQLLLKHEQRLLALEIEVKKLKEPKKIPVIQEPDYADIPVHNEENEAINEADLPF